MSSKLSISLQRAQESGMDCPPEHRSADGLYIPFRFQRKLHEEEKLFHISDTVYIGTAYGAGDLSFLKELGIRHVINLTSGSSLVPNIGQECGYDRIQYTNLPLKDNIGENVDKILATMRICVGHLNSNVPTLIHCNAGLSRSASMVIAWLMSSKKWTLLEAVTHFAEKRGRAAVCSPSYWTALYKYEKEQASNSGHSVPEVPTYDFTPHICDDISTEAGESSSIMLASSEEIRAELVKFNYDAAIMINTMLEKKFGF